MITDFVVPKDNEKQFISVASKLGFKQLVFLYSFDKKTQVSYLVEKVNLLQKETKLRLDVGFLVTDAKLLERAKQSKKTTVFVADQNTDVRALAQKHKPHIITNMEFQRHDFVHHRSSGMNQVIATAMHDEHISYAPAFSLLLSTKYVGEILGRMMQNAILAKKYAVKLQYCSLAKKPYQMSGYNDILSLLRVCGATEKQAKEAMQCK